MSSFFSEIWHARWLYLHFTRIYFHIWSLCGLVHCYMASAVAAWSLNGTFTTKTSYKIDKRIWRIKPFNFYNVLRRWNDPMLKFSYTGLREVAAKATIKQQTDTKTSDIFCAGDKTYYWLVFKHRPMFNFEIRNWSHIATHLVLDVVVVVVVVVVLVLVGHYNVIICWHCDRRKLWDRKFTRERMISQVLLFSASDVIVIVTGVFKTVFKNIN